MVQRQAKHLGLTLLGIPMHRASSESYVSRVTKGLELIRQQFGPKADWPTIRWVGGFLGFEFDQEYYSNIQKPFINEGLMLRIPFGSFWMVIVC